MDHEAHTEQVQGDDPEKQPAVAAGLADQDTDDEKPHAGDDVEDVGNVTGSGDGNARVDAQERGVVPVPAVVRDLVADVKCTSAEDGARAQDGPIEEGHGGEISLVEAESDQSEETDDEHADAASAVPFPSIVIVSVEGQEEDDETSGQKERSGDCESCQKRK